MTSESTEKLQHIYRFQQSKLVSISHLTENLSDIRGNMETFSTEQRTMAGELESCTNKCRVTIRRLEQKGNKNNSNKEENTRNDDDGYELLSPGQKKIVFTHPAGISRYIIVSCRKSLQARFSS